MGAPLAFLGHDEMLLWLRRIENRDKIRKELGMFTSKDINAKLELYDIPLQINIKPSNRFKLKYDHEQYPDIVETWQYEKSPSKNDLHIFIWEAKPALHDFDAILRQINKYGEVIPKCLWQPNTTLRETIKIVVFNVCRQNIKDVAELFQESNVFIYQLLPMEVKTKDELQRLYR